MALEHFSHRHTLIFNEDLQQNEKLSCFGCKEPISGQSYSCKDCNFFLHKACAELPRQIKHTFHRKHPLILQENSPHNDLPCLCDSCGNICGSFMYHCSLCNFNLDKKCALVPCVLEPAKNNHQFIWLVESRIPYNCDSCGGDGSYDSYAYLCTICQLLIHSDCKLLLPENPTVATTIHDHPLTHTFFINENESGKLYCGICNDEILTAHGCYFCSQCSFVSHVGCTFDKIPTMMAQCIEEEFEDHCEEDIMSCERTHESTSLNSAHVVYEFADEDMDSITHGVNEINLEDRQIAKELEIQRFSNEQTSFFSCEAEDEDEQCDKCKLSMSIPNAHCHLKHISHRHPLLFNKEHHIEQISCFLCEKLVLSPSYSCSKCNFLLHKTCAELPLKIKHPFHRKHPLVLIPDSSNLVWRCPCCFFCTGSCRRFAYSCSNCSFYLDVKCARLPCVIEPEAHEHQFIHWMRAIPFTCNACGEKESEQTPYFCTVCQVKVHKSCVSLPHGIKIIQHNHPLRRNHFFHENVSAGSLNCGICEKEVSSEYGSYYCPDYCNFIAHVSCALELEDKDQK